MVFMTAFSEMAVQTGHHSAASVSYALGEVTFEVFRAKDLHAEAWNSDHAKEMVARARQSYRCYGEVPLFDSYDAKSAVYLCRTTYPYSLDIGADPVKMEEWLSLRFIPREGQPFSTEDLDHFFYQNRPVGHYLSEYLVHRGASTPVSAVTISRLCSIRPNLTRPNSRLSAESFSGALRHFFPAFLLLNHAFLSDHEAAEQSFFTAMFNRPILEKITRHPDSHRWPLTFFPAHDFFGAKKSAICLERKHIAYRYPGYFLNIQQILDVLRQLCQAGRLDVAVIKKYVPKFSAELFASAASLSHYALLAGLEGLGELLTVSGRIPETEISGEELRTLMDEHVSDGPELQLMEPGKWPKQIRQVMSALFSQSLVSTTQYAKLLSVAPLESAARMARERSAS